MDLVLIRLVDTGFNGMFSEPHFRQTGPTGGSSLKDLLIGVLTRYYHILNIGIQGLQANLCLI